MSTRSCIAMTKPANNDTTQITSIYCHHDGYPQCVGQMLYDHYNNPERVDKLLSLGDLSSLHPCISPEESEIPNHARLASMLASLAGTSTCWKTLPPHSFDTPYPDVTIAYGRDRGEHDVDAQTSFVSASHVLENAAHTLFYLYDDIVWAYLYHEGTWFASHGGTPFTPLRELLK